MEADSRLYTRKATVSTAREIQNELKVSGRRLRAAIPEVYAGYAALHGAAMGDGVLSAGVKELIALAISAIKECDGCVAGQARSGARAPSPRSRSSPGRRPTGVPARADRAKAQ